MVPKGHGRGDIGKGPLERVRRAMRCTWGVGRWKRKGYLHWGTTESDTGGRWVEREAREWQEEGWTPRPAVQGRHVLDSTYVGHPGPAHHRVPGDPCVTHILSPAGLPPQRRHLLWPQTGLYLHLGLPRGQTRVLWLCDPLKARAGPTLGLTLLPCLWVPLWEPAHVGTQPSWAFWVHVGTSVACELWGESGGAGAEAGAM